MAVLNFCPLTAAISSLSGASKSTHSVIVESVSNRACLVMQSRQTQCPYTTQVAPGCSVYREMWKFLLTEELILTEKYYNKREPTNCLQVSVLVQMALQGEKPQNQMTSIHLFILSDLSTSVVHRQLEIGLNIH